MSKRDPELLMEDIREAVNRIAKYTEGHSVLTFKADMKTADAVVRNLEIIGEATRQMPQDCLERRQDIPWRQMAGLRNRIVHDYFGVDLDLRWQIVSIDLPDLRKKLDPH